MEWIEWRGKRYRVFREPYPHIVVWTKKELHGWWPGKRECTAERLLINPYCGCSIGCPFCYARSFPGWFQLFRDHGIVVVADEFDRVIEEQLDSIDIASPGYLSPVTDPFQPLNEKFHLSEKIIAVFVKRNIPIEFITKAKVPEIVLEMMQSNKHNFGQVSILTLDEALNKLLVPRGASVEVLFDNIRRMSRYGMFSVCRIDPIFPYITDDKYMLKELMQRARDSGAKHIIVSILDIPLGIKDEVLSFIRENFGNEIHRRYMDLYKERIDNYLNADLSYRLALFDYLRTTADKLGLTFALCMEYELNKEGRPQGLNKYFMSSNNCEGKDIPIYRRYGSTFKPIANCLGNCLNCTNPICGIEDLAMGRPNSKKDWKLKDYKRWSTLLD